MESASPGVDPGEKNEGDETNASDVDRNPEGSGLGSLLLAFLIVMAALVLAALLQFTRGFDFSLFS
ncbi:MAG: hypothetical protein ACM3US_03080 [Sphingomonadaceae bacterium]